MDWIAKWVRASEADLAADLLAIGEDDTPASRAHARTLFARVVDSSVGGLRIQSFDDFALALLGNYPFEAGLIPAFRALGKGEQAGLSHRVLVDMQCLAKRERRSELSGAVTALTSRLGPGAAADFLRECARHADAMATLPALIEPWVRSVVGLAGDDEALADFTSFLAQALEAGREYARLYAEAKRRSGACDRDELLSGAVSILEHPILGEQARFQFDQDTHHIFISDAQDTDWRHWRLVRAIAGEFFAGQGAQEIWRTLFVCGDPEAALAGSNPILFQASFTHFRQLAEDAELGFDGVDFFRSYRSAQPLMEFTYEAMRMLRHRETGLLDWEGPPTAGTPTSGQVILLPSDHADGSQAGDAADVHAARLATLIQGWLGSGEILASTGRSPRPEDVAILFQRRGRLASQIVARLQAAGIPAMEERGFGKGHPAISVLLAFARFALDREDKQALSLLLESPLADLAGQASDPLPSTRATAVHGLDLQRSNLTSSAINDLFVLANRATPHCFFVEVLSGDCGALGKLASAWGPEAIDKVDLLVSASLDFERANVPSLEAFLNWFEQIDGDDSVDRSTPCSAVRVMRCDSARNRHFPVVVLADASECEIDPNQCFINYRLKDSDFEVPFIVPDALEAGGSLAALRADAARRALEENRRLFYVAVTSAVDRLVITGPQTSDRGNGNDASWYAACERAFDALGSFGQSTEARVFQGLELRKAGRPGKRRTGRGVRIRTDMSA